MTEELRKARDLVLLDAVDAFSREQLRQTVWRVAREGRDPLLGAPSLSRWCNGTFDVLYTALERDGAIAETYARLSAQPVFPSKLKWFVHKITVECHRLFRADLQALGRLGVDISNYRAREYERTQEVADAAFFLDFDGLLVPSARWTCANLVLFTDRVAPSDLLLVGTEPEPVDWARWAAKTSGS